MFNKKSPLLLIVAGCIFFLLSGPCQAQEGGPIEIGNASSHQQELLNTAKSVGNMVVQEISAIYGLPENDGDIRQWSDARLEAFESGARNSFADRLANQDGFHPLVVNKEKEAKKYVIKDNQTMVVVRLNSEAVPGVEISVLNCKESGSSDFGSVFIDYHPTRHRGETKGEWELQDEKSGDLESIPDKSTPECFSPEIFGDDESKLNKIEHGDHYHYVPENRNKDVPISRFPIEPPGPGEYVTPSGEVVEKEQ